MSKRKTTSKPTRPPGKDSKEGPPPAEAENARVTDRTKKLFRSLSEPLRAAVKADVSTRVRAMRECGVSVDLDRLFIEAIEVAQDEEHNPPPVAVEYEPWWSYPQYQSPRNP